MPNSNIITQVRQKDSNGAFSSPYYFGVEAVNVNINGRPLTEKMSDVDKKISDNTTNVNTALGKAAQQELQLKEHDTKLNNHEQRLTTQGNQLANHDMQLKNHERRIGTNEDDIQYLKSKQETLEDRVVRLEKQVIWVEFESGMSISQITEVENIAVAALAEDQTLAERVTALENQLTWVVIE